MQQRTAYHTQVQFCISCPLLVSMVCEGSVSTHSARAMKNGAHSHGMHMCSKCGLLLHKLFLLLLECICLLALRAQLQLWRFTLYYVLPCPTGWVPFISLSGTLVGHRMWVERRTRPVHEARETGFGRRCGPDASKCDNLKYQPGPAPV